MNVLCLCTQYIELSQDFVLESSRYQGCSLGHRTEAKLIFNTRTFWDLLAFCHSYRFDAIKTNQMNSNDPSDLLKKDNHSGTLSGVVCSNGDINNDTFNCSLLIPVWKSVCLLIAHFALYNFFWVNIERTFWVQYKLSFINRIDGARCYTKINIVQCFEMIIQYFI